MATLQDLRKDTRFLARVKESQYPNSDIDRNINIAYDDLVLNIWRTDGSWKFDEGVNTLPIVSTSLVIGQMDYQIPTSARKIEGVEVIIDGSRHKLNTITPEDLSKHSDETGTPRVYYMKGRSIYLFPQPVKEGTLEMHISKSVTPLENDEDEPKVDREFHRYLSYSATRDWYFGTKQQREHDRVEQKMQMLKEDIRDFYNRRNQGYKKKFKVKRQNYL